MSPDPLPEPTAGQRGRVLWLSTAAFTLLFAVWLMLGMLSIRIKPDLSLTDGQLYNLTIAAILSGSLLRFNFGVWADKYGGRKMLTLLLLLTAVPCVLVSQVTTYEQLLGCAVLYGVAGNAFAVGISWNAAWFPPARQGFALGVFGAGNVGASVTKLFGPFILAAVPAAGFFGGVIPGGWRSIPLLYAVLVLGMAAAVWFLAPKQDRCPGKGRSFAAMAAPAKKPRVWEFSLQYVVVFGAYVALSNVLPKYYLDNFGPELASQLGLSETLVTDFAAVNGLKGDAYAAFMTANPVVKADLDYLVKWVGFLAAVCYVFPASLLRPVGGILSDKFGAKAVMSGVFVGMLVAGVLLTAPIGLGVWAFTAALFLLGAGMGVGKASVYKMIPDAFPKAVGAVGGLVGLLGALGGVALPLAWGPLQSAFGTPRVVFGALLGLTVLSSGWFYLGVLLARPAAVPAREEAVVV